MIFECISIISTYFTANDFLQNKWGHPPVQLSNFHTLESDPACNFQLGSDMMLKANMHSAIKMIKTILTNCSCFDQQVNNSLIQKMNLLFETDFFGHNLWELPQAHIICCNLKISVNAKLQNYMTCS